MDRACVSAQATFQRATHHANNLLPISGQPAFTGSLTLPLKRGIVPGAMSELSSSGHTNDVILPTAEVSAAMRAWLADGSAVVVVVEQNANGDVRLRPLDTVQPEVIARLQVSLAKYREALMNLT